MSACWRHWDIKRETASLNPAYRTLDATFYQGHVVEVLRALPAESVNCVITSPPYWGLRSYEGDQTHIWGGIADCHHDWYSQVIGRVDGGPDLGPDHKLGFDIDQPSLHQTCRCCGAWRGEYGREPTMELYLDHTVLWMKEVKRVLRNDGVVWLNVGDVSWSGGNPNDRYPETSGLRGGPNTGGVVFRPPPHPVLKRKDQALIPFRLAIALQEAGWYVRRDVIWWKSGTKPESVTDRPTKAHEYVFMLTQRARYWYDKYGYEETITPETWGLARDGTYSGKSTKDYAALGIEDPGDIKRRTTSRAYLASGRNMRSVWRMPTAGFAGAHFAVMPEELVERALRVSCPPYVCAECKRPWHRVLQKGDYKQGIPTLPTEEWKESCRHVAVSAEPGVVLDPFGGAGTVAVVARRNTRRSIYIDCAEEYLEMAKRRLGDGIIRLHDYCLANDIPFDVADPRSGGVYLKAEMRKRMGSESLEGKASHNRVLIVQASPAKVNAVKHCQYQLHTFIERM